MGKNGRLRIYSIANERNIPVIELRDVCNQPVDFVDAIEPSAEGGKKIATAIHKCVMQDQRK